MVLLATFIKITNDKYIIHKRYFQPLMINKIIIRLIMGKERCKDKQEHAKHRPDHPCCPTLSLLIKVRFDFMINVNSVDTKEGKRDTHLRSPDFFDAGKYPLITFKSSEVLHAGGNKYIVEGILTIKNVSKKQALEFVYHGQKDNPLKSGELVAGLDARLTLHRLEYNVGDGKFYKMGVVGKDVDILITLELLRDK